MEDLITTPQEFEVEEACIYDDVIKKGLGTEKIPEVKGTYTLFSSSFDVQVNDNDLDTYKDLFYLTPPKKGETEGRNKGVGNGEVALYWLYKYQNDPHDVFDSRQGSDPDLTISGRGVEVKSYSSHTKQIGLGRFGDDKASLKLLNVVFGLYTLVEVLDDDHDFDSKIATSTNFHPDDLHKAFVEVFDFLNTPYLEALAVQYDIFEHIKGKIHSLLFDLDYPKNPDEATKNMLTRLLTNKLDVKPGNLGYVANVKKDGDIRFFNIDFDRLNEKSPELIRNNIYIAQSAIKLNFTNLFYDEEGNTK